MTTATLARPPTQSPTESPEAILQAFRPLIHDACFRLGRRDGEGIALEDLVQEANIHVWKILQGRPVANRTFIFKAAYHGAVHALRQHRRSVDRPYGRTGFETVSLETLEVDTSSGEPLQLEDAIARHRRHDELPDPTQDIALARIMQQELEPLLTPRERQAFALLLLEYSIQEIAQALSIARGYAQRLVMGIRFKAAKLWELPETPVDPSVAFRRCYERNKDRYNANRRAKQGGQP